MREDASAPLRPDLPDPASSRLLAEWLAGPRGRLLRRARIGRCKRVLELGPGHGFVTEELGRRSAGKVVVLDCAIAPALRGRDLSVNMVTGDASALPFSPASFDLALSQNVLLWVPDAAGAVTEAARVLEPGGALVAIEPDFGGMIEHPPEVALKDVWIRGLTASGADPNTGRKLPGLCERAGLDVWVELQNIPSPATPEALGLSIDLIGDDGDRSRVEAAQSALGRSPGEWGAFIHLPYVLLVATKRRSAPTGDAHDAGS